MKRGRWNKGRPNPNKGKKFPAEVLTEGEVQRLLKVTSRSAPTGIRNRAMVVVAYCSGLRLHEVLALFPKDVDLEKGTINVMHGKGDKQRVTGIESLGCEILQRWIDKRREIGFNSRHRLFCTLNGDPIEPAYVRALMKRLGTKAGIEKRVHFHGLRHAFTSEQVNEGTALSILSEALGHSRLTTTMNYCKRVAPQMVIDAIRKRKRNWSV